MVLAAVQIAIVGLQGLQFGLFIEGLMLLRPARSACLDAVLSDTGAARLFPQWIDWVLAQYAVSLHLRTNHDVQAKCP